MQAPKPKKIAHELVAHDHKRIDSFYWMNERENSEVIDHLNLENEYTQTVLKSTEGLQKDLYDEMRSRIEEEDSSAPYFRNGYWYYSRYEEGNEHPIHCRKKDHLENAEEILINENTEAAQHPYYEIVSIAISPDNKMMAFAEDINGRRQYQIRFKNLENQEISNRIIENSAGDMVWANDNNTLYYTTKDTETLRPDTVFSTSFSSGETSLLFEEKDEKFIVNISGTKDFKYLILGSFSTLTTEYQFKSADDNLPFQLFLAREQDHEYYLEILNEICYIKTNKKAPNFCLKSCELHDRAENNWIELQSHDDRILLEDFEVFNEFVITQEKENGLSRLRKINLSTKAVELIPGLEETYTLYLGTNAAPELTSVRVGYTSMTTPHSVYMIDENQDWTLLKQTKVKGDFDKDWYQSGRIWAKAADGVQVPISLVYRKDLFKKDGANPILCYAYGSYGSTIDPYFSTARLSLLNRGFVFAIIHVRGGEYLGRQWYEDGKLLKKMNTFTDFISGAEFLITEKYASPDKVFAMGGSAGGLLMGAVINIKPELWRGVVAQVPFMDVVSTMLDDSIPLTVGEYEEWGNPNEKEYYDYMLSYSPYDNLTECSYPDILVTSGLHDSQVQYWEPTKYVAKLRELAKNEPTVLLHTNMKAGHGGDSGRFEQLKEIALEYAFIISRL